MLSAKPAEVDPPPPETTRAPPPTAFPFHVISGINNFRDIGGWPVTSSSSSQVIGHVRKGILYRSSDTNRVTVEGVSKLRDELNIKVDYDLRSKQQIEKTGGYKDLEGIERRWAPVFGEEEYTEEAARKRYELYAGDGTEGIVEAFTEILIAGAPMFATVLRYLLHTVPPPSPSPSSPPAALFMHCTTGNNRTGVFISVLLLLLGVPTSAICEEYALSEQGLAPTRHINVERLLKKGAFKEYEAEEARRKCERMVGARKESMEALIRHVEESMGGAEGYFRQSVRLSSEEIAGLRKVLIVKDMAKDHEA